MQPNPLFSSPYLSLKKIPQRKKEREEEEIKGKKLRSQPWTIERESDKRRG